MQNHYELPDGKVTINYRRYISSWRKLCKPIEDLTGIWHIAFDPDVQFRSGEDFITLPVWFLNLVNCSLQKVVSQRKKK